MKILFFLDTPYGLGGAGNVLLEQARLISDIHDVLVVIPCDCNGQMNPEYVRRCKRAGIKYRGMLFSTVHELQNIDLVNAWENVNQIKEMALREKADFFHSVQLNLAVEFASRELKIPHLMNIYSIRREEFVFAHMNFFPRYHSCDSELYCRIWKENLGMKTKCIRPSAPRNEIKIKKRGRGGKLKILMLGGVWRHKNQLLAIQAVECCVREGMNIVLTIAGDDTSKYAESCKKYVESNGLENNINIIGFQSDIVPLLEDSNCYLCTSINESFPSSIVESMTYDLTVISTPVAGVPELLKDGVNAYVSKGYKIQDIVACILKCSSAYKTGQIEEIHKQAAMLWKDNFSDTVVQLQLEKYYLYISDDFQRSTNVMSENYVSEKEIREVYQCLHNKKVTDNYPYSRCYYYACMRKMLNQGKAYIWGAGKYGKIAKKILDIFFPWIDILAYIDEKKCGEYQGIKIVSPENIEFQVVDYFFISFVEGKEDVIFFLEKNDLQFNKQIWVLP